MVLGKVLVVDDAPAVMETLCKALVRLGMSTDSILRATRPGEAMDIFHAHKPSVILMDVDLAGEAGDEAAIEILNESPDTKVIMMTGMDPGSTRVRNVVSAGAYAVLEKPIRLTRLREVLDLIESEEKGLRRVQ